MNPENLLYTKTHEWVLVEEKDGAKVATMGLTQFALEALTDLVFIDLPEKGRKVGATESCGEVESVKAVSDLYSPVTGEVIEVHDEVADELEKMGEDPYGFGWLLRIQVSDESSLDHLLDAAAYEKVCQNS